MPPPAPPVRKISHSCSAGTLPTFTQLHVGGDGLLLVPPPARPPSAHQGHVHIMHGSGFLRVWVELRGGGLHVYPNEAASLPSLVVAHLVQCDVTVTHGQAELPYRVAISLQDKEQLSLYLESEEEAHAWASMLRETTVHRSLALEGLNLECGVAGVDDDTASGDSCETESQEDEDSEGRSRDAPDTHLAGGVRLRHSRRRLHPGACDDSTRRELLQQMLATKSLLEKKQKNRKSGAGAWVVTAGEVVNEYDRAQHEAQQSALRKAVLLRQRKNSTAIKMATLERQYLSSIKRSRESGVEMQIEALRNRLSSLDSQLKESEQNTEKTLQDLEEKRNQELHIIKDLGGVSDDLRDELGGVPRNCGSDEGGSVKNSLGGSLRGSLSSLPSIVITGERKTPEKLFGFKVGNREGRLKGRNPLHFLDIKLRVSRRHKSSENLATPSDPIAERSHSSTPANISCSENSSDEELDPHHLSPRQNQNHHREDPSIRTEISKDALEEIEAFKNLRLTVISQRTRAMTPSPRTLRKSFFNSKGIPG
ncbi:uncharacterized protein LOC122250547 isoform X2 [Penaeus japonicus]|uniref:uncharacterized protein LOC122250547 isoform X2 n=1 Tax=Penaeus japonicus TaxID=27405 RepID=UPI001C70DF64|nr:uncharacterized protein LOC122250547 isoform X2 [Penaeus japonicus]